MLIFSASRLAGRLPLKHPMKTVRLDSATVRKVSLVCSEMRKQAQGHLFKNVNILVGPNGGCIMSALKRSKLFFDQKRHLAEHVSSVTL